MSLWTEQDFFAVFCQRSHYHVINATLDAADVTAAPSRCGRAGVVVSRARHLCGDSVAAARASPEYSHRVTSHFVEPDTWGTTRTCIRHKTEREGGEEWEREEGGDFIISQTTESYWKLNSCSFKSVHFIRHQQKNSHSFSWIKQRHQTSRTI